MMDWKELAATSHYQTAVAIGRELDSGHIDEATSGISELIDAVGRSERRALRSQLTRLMVHVLKWNEQPRRRTGSWASTIEQARIEIADILEEVPSIGREGVVAMWDHCFGAATRQAEAETGKPVSARSLSWEEVFETLYRAPKGE